MALLLATVVLGFTTRQRNLNDIDLYVIVTLHYYSCKQIGDMMVSFTNAAANGGLLLAGLFMALFLYVYVTDAL